MLAIFATIFAAPVAVPAPVPTIPTIIPAIPAAVGMFIPIVPSVLAPKHLMLMLLGGDYLRYRQLHLLDCSMHVDEGRWRLVEIGGNL